MRKLVKFRSIKPEIRILGVDDGTFVSQIENEADVVGVVFRGRYWLDGVMRTKVKVDGKDSTEKITNMIIESPHYGQIRVIVLSGLTFAGFNVVDIKELFEVTGIPVIVLTRKRPDFDEIKDALKNLPDSAERWSTIQKAGDITPLKTLREAEPVYIQIAGIERGDAETIIKISSLRSSVPEALRVAHIIASGLAKSMASKEKAQ